MDAAIYLTNLSRLCDYYTSREMCGNNCPVSVHCNSGNDITEEEAKESVAAVEKWSKENQVETNGEVVVKLLKKIAKMGGVMSQKQEFFGLGNPTRKGRGIVIEIVASEEWWDAETEPLSDAYMKAVLTWLLDYQIRAAELKGRYTAYEVLSWVVNDWRKEHE